MIIPAFTLMFGADAKLAGSMSILVGIPTTAVGLLRHLGTGSPLQQAPVWAETTLPLAAGPILEARHLGIVPLGALKLGLGVILI